MDNWQGDTNAWEDESDATWEAEEVLRLYFIFIFVINLLFCLYQLWSKILKVTARTYFYAQWMKRKQRKNLFLDFPIICTNYVHYGCVLIMQTAGLYV